MIKLFKTEADYCRAATYLEYKYRLLTGGVFFPAQCNEMGPADLVEIPLRPIVSRALTPLEQAAMAPQSNLNATMRDA